MSAIIVPGINYRQLPNKSRTTLDARFINVHTMVWDLVGCENYFSKYGNPYSHFGTGYDGEIRQWQDLRYRAASDLYGNPTCISIENADKGPGFPNWSGSDVPPFTAAQVESLVVLISWLCHRFSLPRSVVQSSCPHERGIGYHRLGCDPWRNTNCGTKWSNARGKVCPGDRRIYQLHYEIMPAVSSPVPTPFPEEDELQVNIAWLRPKAGSNEGAHCYRFTEAGIATWLPTTDAINTQLFLGAKMVGPLDPNVWVSMKLENGPLLPQWVQLTTPK